MHVDNNPLPPNQQRPTLQNFRVRKTIQNDILYNSVKYKGACGMRWKKNIKTTLSNHSFGCHGTDLPSPAPGSNLNVSQDLWYTKVSCLKPGWFSNDSSSSWRCFSTHLRTMRSGQIGSFSRDPGLKKSIVTDGFFSRNPRLCQQISRILGFVGVIISRCSSADYASPTILKML